MVTESPANHFLHAYLIIKLWVSQITIDSRKKKDRKRQEEKDPTISRKGLIFDAQGFEVRALQTVFAKDLQESFKRT